MKVVANIEYERLREIGAGEGMNSKVYLAADPQLDGTIAVKEVPKSDFGNDIAAYFGEAQAMYKAQHDNIVPLHYAGATDTHVCIAMPFFQRGSFAREVQHGPAQLSRVLSTGRAVLDALAQIHLAGLLHLDVKPTNVLLSDRGVPMLADFGQARRMSETGVAVPTKMYYRASPPEAFGGVVTVASDIYQAALLLYRATNGDPHFLEQWSYDLHKDAAAVMSGRLPRRDAFLPHVPDRLRRVIRKGLRPRPEERYQSATEFADALGTVPCILDWTTSVDACGGYVWSSKRAGQPDLIVVATVLKGRWTVEVYTGSINGTRRAKGRSLFWKSGLSWKAATKHLTAVFEHLP